MAISDANALHWPFSLKMSEGVPAPHKRTQPPKLQVPKKLKLKVEEAPVVPDPQKETWDKELDELFKNLREHPPQEEKEVKIDDNLYFPLHTNVLNKKVSQKGWEYTRCQVKNCPTWLPWDKYLQQILMEVHFNMHPSLRQGLFYCFYQEPCKVALTKKEESPNRGHCFLTCTQKNAQREGCRFFQWIDQEWDQKNAQLPSDLSTKFFENVIQKVKNKNV